MYTAIHVQHVQIKHVQMTSHGYKQCNCPYVHNLREMALPKQIIWDAIFRFQVYDWKEYPAEHQCTSCTCIWTRPCTCRVVNNETACGNSIDADAVVKSKDGCAYEAKMSGAKGFCVQGFKCYILNEALDTVLASAPNSTTCDQETGQGTCSPAVQTKLILLHFKKSAPSQMTAAVHDCLVHMPRWCMYFWCMHLSDVHAPLVYMLLWLCVCPQNKCRKYVCVSCMFVM